ncbi:MAG: exo-alpha-sialidase, partial [Candidatus Bathyarchaeia archaeon]
DCLFHSRFLVSDENQENWHQRGEIYSAPGCLEPSIVQLPRGDILCYMRYGARGGGHIWRSISSDEGQSFSPPELTTLRNPHSGIDIALSTTGRLLITYNDSYYLRTPVCIGVSDDYGKTWRVRDIEFDVGEYSYPKLIQTSDGLWHIFYTHNRTHIQHGWFDEEWLENRRKVIGLRN